MQFSSFCKVAVSRLVEFYRKHTNFTFATLVACLFCFPLFDFELTPGGDWPAHVWFIDYMANYFRSQGSIPYSISNDELVGVLSPIYYAFGLFPQLALLACGLGGNLSVRVYCLIITFCLAYFLLRTLAKLNVSILPRVLITILGVFTIYQLSCIYNRGSFVEYLATTSLFTGCILLFYYFVIEDRPFACWGTAFFYSFAAVTHAITALYGTFFTSIILFACLFFTNGSIKSKISKVLRFWLPMLCIICAVLPWGIEVVLHSKQTTIYHYTQNRGMLFFKSSTDGWLARISPYLWEKNLPNETPELDAPLNVPLFAVCLFMLISSLKNKQLGFGRFFAWLLLLVVPLALLLVLSCDKQAWFLIPKIFHMIQFGLRLVSYQNMFLMFWLLFFFKFNSFCIFDKNFKKMLVLCFFFLFLPPLVQKFEKSYRHLFLTTKVAKFNSDDTKFIKDIYFLNDYSFPYHVKGVDLQAENGSVVKAFFQINPLTLNPQKMELNAGANSLILTNVVVHPYNKILLGGQFASSEMLQVYQLAVGPAGNVVPCYAIKKQVAEDIFMSYEFSPPFWIREGFNLSILSVIAQLVIFIWLFLGDLFIQRRHILY